MWWHRETWWLNRTMWQKWLDVSRIEDPRTTSKTLDTNKCTANTHSLTCRNLSQHALDFRGMIAVYRLNHVFYYIKLTTSSFSFCAETDNIIFCTTITTFELIQTILLWLFLYKCFTNWNNFSNVITNWKFCIAYIPLTLRSIVMTVLLQVFHILKHFLQCVHNLTILYCVNTIDINENDESCLHISMKSHFFNLQ